MPHWIMYVDGHIMSGSSRRLTTDSHLVCAERVSVKPTPRTKQWRHASPWPRDTTHEVNDVGRQ